VTIALPTIFDRPFIDPEAADKDALFLYVGMDIQNGVVYEPVFHTFDGEACDNLTVQRRRAILAEEGLPFLEVALEEYGRIEDLPETEVWRCWNEMCAHEHDTDFEVIEVRLSRTDLENALAILNS